MLCCNGARCVAQIVCGNRAGALTVLLDLNGSAGHRNSAAAGGLEGELLPTHVVHSLTELTQLLSEPCRYVLAPPPNPHAAVEAVSVNTA